MPKLKAISIEAGKPLPLGASVQGETLNFALFCRATEQVTLLIFTANGRRLLHRLALDPQRHRTGDVWHIALSGLAPTVCYAYQLAGGDSDRDPEQLILDPYAKRIVGGEQWGRPVSTWLCGLAADDFDWQGDRPLNRPLTETIIYELHVRGFTRHPSSQVRHPGTYAGIVEKIPYLRSLGVTALELLPIAEFSENEVANIDPVSGRTLKNFWGYSSFAYFAPKASFAALPGQQVTEFKTMVRALHQAGIEVILDVVFNHTAEGNSRGPTLSFRALGNTVYYLVGEEPSDYRNFSGCGNTVNCNHPIVRDFIMDCLRYWVLDMHVDGFRFDLASIMTRGKSGEVLNQPPIVEQIAEDPILANTKIIAEAWDASGLYQVGHFSSHPRWCEWNGRFRDDCRSFLAGHHGKAARLATRIAGSSDLYQHNQRRPANSINFLTSHDGFTLWDLVCYNQKHNIQNGEDNRDGDNNNFSWNSGKEGRSRSVKVQALRARRLRSMAVVLLLSQGTPMLVAGDEFCRSQQGNNNAYCQDNPISWLDWGLVAKNQDVLRFFTMLIRLRQRYTLFRRHDFFPPPHGHRPEIVWQGKHRHQEDWSHDCQLLCFRLSGAPTKEPDFFVIVSGSTQESKVELPHPAKGRVWLQLIDTSRPSPMDIVAEAEANPLHASSLAVAAMSAVVLISADKKKA